MKQTFFVILFYHKFILILLSLFLFDYNYLLKLNVSEINNSLKIKKKDKE